MIVARETVTVYRGAKRRYLTEWAAYRSLAIAAYYERHPCTCEAEVGYDCRGHTPEREHYAEKCIAMLARLMRARDRKDGTKR